MTSSVWHGVPYPISQSFLIDCQGDSQEENTQQISSFLVDLSLGK
jgi:hypothetical protein